MFQATHTISLSLQNSQLFSKSLVMIQDNIHLAQKTLSRIPPAID